MDPNPSVEKLKLTLPGHQDCAMNQIKERYQMHREN